MMTKMTPKVTTKVTTKVTPKPRNRILKSVLNVFSRSQTSRRKHSDASQRSQTSNNQLPATSQSPPNVAEILNDIKDLQKEVIEQRGTITKQDEKIAQLEEMITSSNLRGTESSPHGLNKYCLELVNSSENKMSDKLDFVIGSLNKALNTICTREQYIQNKLDELNDKIERNTCVLSTNVEQIESRLQQQYSQLESKILECHEQMKKAQEFISTNSVRNSDRIVELEHACQKFQKDLSTGVEKVESLLREQYANLETACQTFCNNLSTHVDHIESRLQQKDATLETKMSEHEEEMKQIKELLTQRYFQATGSGSLPLNSMAQEAHLQNNIIQSSREISPNAAYKHLTKKKILCVYSESKVYTDNTLKKLEHDLLQECDVECLSIYNLNTYQSTVPDKLFFFYFLTNGREQAEAINDILAKMSTMWAEKPMYLIILKDAQSGQSCIDLQRVSLPSEKVKTYQIFSEGYANFLLYIEKPKRSMSGGQLKQIKQNYESLVEDMKAKISRD